MTNSYEWLELWASRVKILMWPGPTKIFILLKRRHFHLSDLVYLSYILFTIKDDALLVLNYCFFSPGFKGRGTPE